MGCGHEVTPLGFCKTCYSREYMRRRMQRRRRILHGYKMMLGCKDCGFWEHPEALDFDQQGTKNGLVSRLYVTAAWSRVLKELELCEVRCANCHRIKTRRESNGV